MRGWLAAGALLIVAAASGRPSAAQEGVTCGITYGPDGNMINLGACGNQPGQATYFAAVAISASTLNMGSSHGQSSQGNAEQQAMQICQSSGSKDCAIAYWARNECVALATTAHVPGTYGAAFALDRASAAAAALAQCTSRGGKGCTVRVTPCAGDDVKWPSPLPLPPGSQPGSVDPNLVGIWALTINPGYWVWEIGRNGTYTFHSEAMDGAPSHMGTFTASNGKYSMRSTNMDGADAGTYKYTAPGTLMTIGPHGTGPWHRIAKDPDP